MFSPLLRFQAFIAISLFCFCGILTSHEARATKWVANNGVDRTGCGTQRNPCRSISFTIDSTIAGDTILVGPGRYGELDSDGRFDSPGEEEADLNRHCIICVDKRVRIFSTHGADATVIESGGDTTDNALTYMVLITASSAWFGDYGRGFRLSHPKGTAVYAEGRNQSIIGNSVTGNRASVGFAVRPTEGTAHVAGNFATGFVAAGFSILGSRQNDGVSAGGTAIVTDNVAVDNLGSGFAVGGVGNDIRSNTSTGNVFGFSIGCRTCNIAQNLVIDNFSVGVLVGNDGSKGTPSVRDNSIIGNGVGVLVRPQASTRIIGNEIFGNFGCGIDNRSGRVINASRNYWGASTGPGADPADPAGPGSGCDDASSSTTVVPFDVRPD